MDARHVSPVAPETSSAPSEAAKRREPTVRDAMLAASPSLTGRALLALGLLIGFYVLALAIAAALLFILWLEARFQFASVYVTLACLFGAIGILVSIIPRSSQFVVPGPRLTKKDQPRLFDAIEEVARACKQRVPSEVYLIPQVNAWVTQRGGILGLFSRRVLGIGLPLLQVAPLSQFRGVLAHEFGHYDAGDTLLGPLIYQTRSAIGRTIGAASASGSFLDVPFELYGEVYLGLTQSISRQQELNADRLACRVAGSRAVTGILRTINAATPAYSKYWNAEIAPILEAGFLPPIAEGFGRYFAAALADPEFVEGVEIEIAREQPDRFDSHPPDRERIAAAQMFPPGDSPAVDPPAITLLDDPQRWEWRMLRLLADAKTADSLQPVTWDEVVAKVYLPGWEESIRKHAVVLGSISVETVPGSAQNLLGLADKLKLSLLYRDSATRQAAEVLGVALACALVRQGWVPESAPGKPVACRRGPVVLEPVSIVQRFASGELSRDGWRQECAALGIANASLAPSPG